MRPLRTAAIAAASLKRSSRISWIIKSHRYVIDVILVDRVNNGIISVCGRQDHLLDLAVSRVLLLQLSMVVLEVPSGRSHAVQWLLVRDVVHIR